MKGIEKGRTKPKRGAEANFSVDEVRAAFTKSERTRAAKHLDAVLKFFGSKGERWVQSTYLNKDEGVLSACLVGAMERVDGPYAYAAQQMLLAVMPKSKDMFGDLEYSNIEDFNDFETTTFGSVKRLIAKAQKALVSA